MKNKTTRKNTSWTVDMIQDEAFKYKSRWEFNKGSVSAYHTALKKGILDKICSHMPQAMSGYDKTKAGSIYLIIIDDKYLGYGITGDLNQRLKEHKRNLDLANRHHYLFASATFEDGQIPLDIENEIKEKFVQVDLEVEGFRTEATKAEHLDEILDIIHNYQKKS